MAEFDPKPAVMNVGSTVLQPLRDANDRDR
jgi:hypothetical protein